MKNLIELLKKAKRYVILLLIMMISVPVIIAITRIEPITGAQIFFGLILLAFLYIGYDSFKKHGQKKLESAKITVVSFCSAAIIVSILVITVFLIEIKVSPIENTELIGQFASMAFTAIIFNLFLGGIVSFISGLVGAYAAEKL